MPYSATSDHDQHCLPSMQQFLDTSIGSQIQLLKFKNKYGTVNSENVLILRVSDMAWNDCLYIALITFLSVHCVFNYLYLILRSCNFD